jgi:hypothetical protein
MALKSPAYSILLPAAQVCLIPVTGVMHGVVLLWFSRFRIHLTEIFEFLHK